MEYLYYLPISLVEHVLFEVPENGLAIDFGEEVVSLEFTNSELQKYYEHYYVHIQNEAKGVEYGEDYKIPIGVSFEGEKAFLIPFKDFRKDFDSTHLSRIESIILNIDGKEKEFFLIQLEKSLLEEAAFDNEEISIDLGKWKVKISHILIPIIISSLSEKDEKAILAYEQEEEELELVGLLVEPDFEDSSRRTLTIKKI